MDYSLAFANNCALSTNHAPIVSGPGRFFAEVLHALPGFRGRRGRRRRAGDLANFDNLDDLWEFINKRLPTGVFSDRRLVWVKDKQAEGDVSFSITADLWAQHCETPLAFARCFKMFFDFKNK
jgi:hypothetical protein